MLPSLLGCRENDGIKETFFIFLTAPVQKTASFNSEFSSEFFLASFNSFDPGT